MTRAVGRYSDDTVVFFNAASRLYEFRTAEQGPSTLTLDSSRAVARVLTPRRYAALCRINHSFPMTPLNDAGWTVRRFVVPRPTPYYCEDDAGPQGVFLRALPPPYTTHVAYTRNYRRAAARLANYHHIPFGITIAVTVDWAPIQNLLVPRSILFGPQSPFAFAMDAENGRWRRGLYARVGLAFAVTAAALAVVGQLATLPQLQFRCHRLVVAAAVAAVAAAGLAATARFTEAAVGGAAVEARMARAESLGRCLAAALTSPTLAAHGGAMADFTNGFSLGDWPAGPLSYQRRVVMMVVVVVRGCCPR